MAIQVEKTSQNNNEKERTNMSISLEQIDLIMKRTGATYTQSKEALERSNGDIIEAIALLEREGHYNGKQQNCNTHQAEEKIHDCVETIKTTYFTLSKNGHEYINAPATAIIIVMLLCFHVSIIALLVAIVCGFKIRLTDKVTQKVRFSNEDFTK